VTDSSIPRAVPSAVAPSTANTVPVNAGPTRDPRLTAQGGTRNPVVPKTPAEGIPAAQPSYGSPGHTGVSPDYGSDGAPSVPPMNGILFRKSPADAHYTDTREVNDPYDKVNNPAPRGRYTWIKTFINGIGLGTQNRENTGWNIRQPQQRTSVWRPLMPGHAAGFAPQTFTPRQLPQTPRWNRDIPIIGTDPYGTGVLNADTFGAGQTAGGIGGSRYTPPPGPPETISTADQGISNSSGMPSWG
jgi:hypothetical protein